MSFRDQLQRSLRQVIPGLAQSPQRQEGAIHPASSLEEEIISLRETNLELLETLGSVVDSLSPYTLFHSTQVAIYALHIARQMDLSAAEQERIFKAGLVHDVGMISLTNSAILKDERLSSEDFSTLRMHPTIGGEIIGRIEKLRDLAPLVHYHHERFDGEGYPDRLSGEEIPLGARILALADSLDAMLTERPGRPGRLLEEVMEEVRCCSGAQFDPAVARAFLQLAIGKGTALFSCANKESAHDMLLTTVGISSGRARKELITPARRPGD